MITAVMAHNDFYGCQKCITRGVWVRNVLKKGGRVMYPEVDARLRTNNEFRDNVYVNHYNKKQEKSILLRIVELYLIGTFKLDFMH